MPTAPIMRWKLTSYIVQYSEVLVFLHFGLVELLMHLKLMLTKPEISFGVGEDRGYY